MARWRIGWRRISPNPNYQRLIEYFDGRVTEDALRAAVAVEKMNIQRFKDVATVMRGGEVDFTPLAPAAASDTTPPPPGPSAAEHAVDKAAEKLAANHGRQGA